MCLLSVPPFLIQPPANRSGDVGDDIELTCVVGGDPAPDIYWSLPRGERRKGDALLHVLKVNALQRRYDVCIPRYETLPASFPRLELGTRPRSFISGNICFKFSVQCLCRVALFLAKLFIILPRTKKESIFITAKDGIPTYYMSVGILEASQH